MAVYTDDFNRADNSTNPGGNWARYDSLGLASAKCGISVNRFCLLTLGGNGNPIYGYNNTFANDQYSQAAIGSGTTFLGGSSTTNPNLGLLLRCQATGGSAYYFRIYDNPSGSITSYIHILSGGYVTGTVMAASTAVSYAVGDVIRFEVSGSGASTNFIVKKNNTQIFTATDSAGTYSSGKAGITGVYNSIVGTHAFWDDWEGGDLSVATPTLANRDYGVQGYARTIVTL